MREPLLKHQHIIKLGRLLNMLYRPSEIADEIGIAVDTVYRSYLPAGLPHTRDEAGEIWIHGPAFRDWARQTIARKKSQRVPLPDGQAWCLKCKGPVPLINPAIKVTNRYLELLQGICPICGRLIHRARKHQLQEGMR